MAFNAQTAPASTPIDPYERDRNVQSNLVRRRFKRLSKLRGKQSNEAKRSARTKKI